ncbi:MAG TPA: hypothetical protein VME46_06710 [Acidimicrobiales bacterium]|nr:hypothetical protein [Acidimicrobiales bacterium]
MLVIAAAVVVAFELEDRGQGKGPGASVTTRLTPSTTTPPPPPRLVTSALAHAPLPVPIVATLVLPGSPGHLLIIGGGLSDGNGAYGVFSMSTVTGTLHQVANLASPLDYASGAVLGRQVYVFGGKGTAITSTVESFPASGATAQTRSTGSSTATTAVPTATATGALPKPRAGSVAVKIGTTVYVVGGYYGDHPQGAVLATSDGGTFTTVARLPVPVRDAAAAAKGGKIYVFGGERLVAPKAGRAGHATPTWVTVRAVQEVDPATGRATVIGKLRSPVEGALAVNLGGNLYLAGGNGVGGVNAQIWGFEPATAGWALCGHLKAPVADAGFTVIGGTKAWVVGGMSTAGRLVGTVQTFRPTAQAASPARGSSPRTTTTSTSPAR